MNEVSTNLLERAKRLNKMAEMSMVALGMVLVEIRDTEAFRGQYDDFRAYYETELGKSKGTITKLLRVGELCLQAGFRAETEPEKLKGLEYTKIYASILAHPDETPQGILAAATTLSLREITLNERDNKHPDCAHNVIIRICAACNKRVDDN